MQTNEKETLLESWEKIKEYIRTEYNLTGIAYNTWIRNLKCLDIKDHVVTIGIPLEQSHALSYIAGKFRDFFQVTISEMMNDDYEVSFVLEKDVINEAPQAETPTKAAIYENANLNPRYRFDTFVVGSNNKFAQSAAVAVAESPGDTYNPLFLYGGAGLGKTHLMQSIGHYVLQNNPNLKVLYVTSEQFTNEVIESIRSGNAASMAKLRDKYRTVDVLLIDDVQFIIGKESTQEEFFNTFNALHTSGKQIVLSSDRPPKEMEILDERIRSRFEWGLIADIQAPDYETRMAILRKNAEEMDTPINDEILNYIASNLKSNIRELEGSLLKVKGVANLNNGDITLEGAKEALKDIIYPDAGEKMTPQRIAKTVCDHYGVRFSNVASKKKNAELVIPRQVIMYICREYTDSTYESVAHLLGKKDHSTVIHGVDKIKEELQKNEEMRNNVDNILKKLNLSN